MNVAKLVAKIVWHALPIVPLALGYHALAIAAALLVALPYIKAAKAGAYIVTIEQRLADTGSQDAAHLTALAKLRKTRQKWRSLTFLSAGPEVGV